MKVVLRRILIFLFQIIIYVAAFSLGVSLSYFSHLLNTKCIIKKEP